MRFEDFLEDWKLYFRVIGIIALIVWFIGLGTGDDGLFFSGGFSALILTPFMIGKMLDKELRKKEEAKQ